MAIPVRRATADDAAELSRLREIMFASAGPAPDRTLWWDAAVRELQNALADPDGPLQAFVVDVEGGSGASGELASSAVGIIDRRLPSAHNPIGLAGYILSVATDPRYRRRGYARAVVQATLDWFESHGIQRVELHASTEAEAMYRSMGFVEPHGLALTRWGASSASSAHAESSLTVAASTPPARRSDSGSPGSTSSGLRTTAPSAR